MKQSKHIEQRFQFNSKKVRQSLLTIVYFCTGENVAVILTKGLNTKKLHKQKIVLLNSVEDKEV